VGAPLSDDCFGVEFVLSLKRMATPEYAPQMLAYIVNPRRFEPAVC
jgi:hypothetical protein